MCFMLRDALRVGCIGLSKHFFSNSMEKREMLKILDDEMRNFSVLVEAPKTPFGKGRKTYSGKVCCKWIRTTDRLLMTLSHSHTLHTGRWAQRRRYYHNVRTRKLNRNWQSPEFAASTNPTSTRTSVPYSSPSIHHHGR
eukprot:7391939-Prymnesium_polylepis.1